MKKLALLVVLLSLGVFSFGCNKKEPPATPPADAPADAPADTPADAPAKTPG